MANRLTFCRMFWGCRFGKARDSTVNVGTALPFWDKFVKIPLRYATLATIPLICHRPLPPFCTDTRKSNGAPSYVAKGMPCWTI